jgi:hypothetical protein
MAYDGDATIYCGSADVGQHPVKIPYQVLISVPHILRPDDVSSINVSPVVNPFVNRVVAGTVVNNDDMLAACMLEAFQDFGTLPMPGISIGAPRYSEIFGIGARETHGQTQDANDRDEGSSQVSTASPPLPKVAQSLNHDGINDAGHGRKIMRLVPSLNR